MDNTPKVQRTILEVALLEGQFRLSLEGSPTAVQDGRVIVKALERAAEFLELVLKPEAALRERWRLEDLAPQVADAMNALSPEQAKALVPGSEWGAAFEDAAAPAEVNGDE